MLRKLLKNKKGQNTAEYAILIGLVIAGITAMQTFAQRALQARVRDASTYMVGQTNFLGNTVQYEPYYTQRDYVVNRESTDETRLGEDLVSSSSLSNRVRTGSETTVYCKDLAPVDDYELLGN